MMPVLELAPVLVAAFVLPLDVVWVPDVEGPAPPLLVPPPPVEEVVPSLPQATNDSIEAARTEADREVRMGRAYMHSAIGRETSPWRLPSWRPWRLGGSNAFR
jgi:hypothetical protein